MRGQKHRFCQIINIICRWDRIVRVKWAVYSFCLFVLNLNATGICEKNKVNSYNISSGHKPSVETSAVFWISWYTQNKYYNLSTVLINEDTFAKSLVLCFLNDLILNQTKVKGHSLYTLEESQHALSMHACM